MEYNTIMNTPIVTLIGLKERLAERADKFSEISRVGIVITLILALRLALPVTMEAAINVINSLIYANGISLLHHKKRAAGLVKADELVHDAKRKLEPRAVRISSFLAVPPKSPKKIVGAALDANNGCARPKEFIKLMLATLVEYAADPANVDDTTFLLADMRPL